LPAGIHVADWIEIERMQREILDYLVKMPPSAKRTTAA